MSKTTKSGIKHRLACSTLNKLYIDMETPGMVKGSLDQKDFRPTHIYYKSMTWTTRH